MKRSFCFGLGCGLASLTMLRWRRGTRIAGGGGGMMSKYASTSAPLSSATRTRTASSSSHSNGGYTFDPLPPKSSHAALQQQQQYQQHSRNFNNTKQQRNNSLFGSAIDVTLATLLGLGTSLLAIETDIFYPKATTTTDANDNQTTTANTNTIEPPPQWISPNIPLVPGRSTISDTLCAPLTSEFRKFPKQLWQSGKHQSMGIENGYNNHMALYANSGWKGTKYYQGNDNASVISLGENADAGTNMSRDNSSNIGDSTSTMSARQQGVYEQLVLDNLQSFIINCERRSRHEQKIRKLKGIRDKNYNRHVVIPSEGVVADEDLELDDIYLIENEEDEGCGDAEFGL